MHMDDVMSVRTFLSSETQILVKNVLVCAALSTSEVVTPTFVFRLKMIQFIYCNTLIQYLAFH